MVASFTGVAIILFYLLYARVNFYKKFGHVSENG